MKKNLFYAILMIVFLFGCNPDPINPKEVQLKQGYILMDECQLQVMEQDSCEYLYAYTGSNTGFIFTHKGNCKYCANRAKKINH